MPLGKTIAECLRSYFEAIFFKKMSYSIFINNQILKASDASISIAQRGFLYGDGVFESCKVSAGKIINFENHLWRLNQALKYLKIPSDTKIIEQNSQILINKNNFHEGILRISVTRGIGSNGYLPTNNSDRLIIIETKKTIPSPEQINLGISYRNPPGFFFKSNSALSYVLTRIEAHEQGFFDNILIDDFGNVCETSSANIFWIKNKEIFTSKDESRIVHGCIRKKILELKLLKVLRKDAKLIEIIDSDEVFITNSNHTLLGVDSINYEINDEKFKKIFSKNIVNLIKKELQRELNI